MLERRGWQSALEELRKAENEYSDGDWVNAVRDYYAALESGFKFALHEEGKSYSDKNALGKLAGRAVAVGLIPEAYKSLFAFADAIRSPRSHGAGPKSAEKLIEIGQAEALLIGYLFDRSFSTWATDHRSATAQCEGSACRVPPCVRAEAAPPVTEVRLGSVARTDRRSSSALDHFSRGRGT